MGNRYLKGVAACLLLGALVVVSGCTQKKIVTHEESPPPSPAYQPPVGEVESLEAQPVESRSNLPITEGRTTGPMRPIYFDYDQDEIREDQKGRMETNGRYLLDTPNAVVSIEGNSDERGTNEYNLALGERRAATAKIYLTTMGVDAGRLSTISYGEERPLNNGHDELALSQNRRDDFVQR